MVKLYSAILLYFHTISISVLSLCGKDITEKQSKSIMKNEGGMYADSFRIIYLIIFN